VLERSVRVGRAVSPEGGATPLIGLALIAHYQGDDEAALQYCHQCRQTMAETGMRPAEVLVFVGHVLTHLGRLEEAAQAYLEAEEVVELDFVGFGLPPELLGGEARLLLAQGKPKAALAHVERILAYAERYPTLSETIEPYQIYLTCYRVLRANGDPRAGSVLHTAYRVLQEQAAQIEDPARRHTFLGVAARREIATTWEKASGEV
jgi:tetratricopeptide (TPR) repeat protein